MQSYGTGDGDQKATLQQTSGSGSGVRKTQGRATNMSAREVKRVPMDFDHPINEVWPGYLLSPIPCPKCGRCPDTDGEYDDCGTCLGDYWYPPPDHPPRGEGWQLWDNVGDGSPMTPVFATAEELARHCAECRVGWFAYDPAPFEAWLDFITGKRHDAGLLFVDVDVSELEDLEKQTH